MGAPQLGSDPRGIRGLTTLTGIPARTLCITTHLACVCYQHSRYLAQFGR
jgi:hypothetical protein